MAVAVAAGWGEDADLSPWSLSLPPFLLVCAASGPHPPTPRLPPAAPSLHLGRGSLWGRCGLEEAFAFTRTTTLEHVCDSRCS